jgi:hypothetical protein
VMNKSVISILLLLFNICIMILCIDKMFTRGSPKILALSKVSQKKVSPKASASKKCRGKDLKFI